MDKYKISDVDFADIDEANCDMVIDAMMKDLNIKVVVEDMYKGRVTLIGDKDALRNYFVNVYCDGWDESEVEEVFLSTMTKM